MAGGRNPPSIREVTPRQAAMNPNREEALFALALEKPAEKRAVWLDAECEGDAALLAAHESAGVPPSASGRRGEV